MAKCGTVAAASKLVCKEKFACFNTEILAMGVAFIVPQSRASIALYKK